uniref:Uncharacterized protein n=1 Tax=Avena sativa TaxID=4498 RepID=A0ACD5TVE0_AVESA
MSMSASRMIVNSLGGAARTGNNASSFRTLKAVGESTNIVGGFSNTRRFSDIAGYRLLDKITANTSQFGEYCFALYLGGMAGAVVIAYGLSYMVCERRERRERSRFPRYDDDIKLKHDDLLQFDDDAMDSSQDQLVSRWREADDRKLAQLEAEIAGLCGAVGRFDLRAENTELREELLRAGTAAEVLEIRERYDGLVEGISRTSSQWRAEADVKLAEYNREMRERIQEEVQRKQNGL